MLVESTGKSFRRRARCACKANMSKNLCHIGLQHINHRLICCNPIRSFCFRCSCQGQKGPLPGSPLSWCECALVFCQGG